jgi:hypothetical protein
MLREGINYAVLSKNSTIPNFLKNRVKNKIKDKNTGITFLALK